MHGRERGSETGVALVGYKHERTCLGHENIAASDAHARSHEVRAKFGAHDPCHAFNVFWVKRAIKHAGEHGCYLSAPFVDGWNDEMARAVFRALQQPLAEVGFNSGDALLL